MEKVGALSCQWQLFSLYTKSKERSDLKINPTFAPSMAAQNIAQPWICGWPNSTKRGVQGYTINQPLNQANLIFPNPMPCGSFSVKNERPLEFSWTTMNGARVGAYLVQDPQHPFVATITFHPVASVQNNQGRWIDTCITHMPLPVPNPVEFRIMLPGIHHGLILIPFDLLSYKFLWPTTHRFIIQGLPWETFIQQISVARFADIGPFENHNFKSWGREKWYENV